MSNFAEDFIADLETYATGSYLRGDAAQGLDQCICEQGGDGS